MFLGSARGDTVRERKNIYMGKDDNWAGKYVFDLRSLTTQQRLTDPRHNLADFYYIRTRALLTYKLADFLHNKIRFYTGPLQLRKISWNDPRNISTEISNFAFYGLFILCSMAIGQSPKAHCPIIFRNWKELRDLYHTMTVKAAAVLIFNTLALSSTYTLHVLHVLKNTKNTKKHTLCQRSSINWVLTVFYNNVEFLSTSFDYPFKKCSVCVFLGV